MKITKRTISDRNKSIFGEIKCFARLPWHDHVMKYEEAFFDESNRFHIVLENLESGSLLSRMKKNRNGFVNDKIFKWSDEMAQGLDFLHNKAIIHGDIRPANILFDKNERLKLGDFAEARIISNLYPDFETTNPYMSPELIKLRKSFDKNIEITVRTDIWSAGTIIFELAKQKIPLQSFDTSFKSSVSSVRSSKLDKRLSDFHLNTFYFLIDLAKNMLNRNPNSRPDSTYLRDKFENFKRENRRKMMNPSNSDILASCLKITKSELSLRK